MKIIRLGDVLLIETVESINMNQIRALTHLSYEAIEFVSSIPTDNRLIFQLSNKATDEDKENFYKINTK